MTWPVLEPTPGIDWMRPRSASVAQLVDRQVADRVGGLAERLLLVPAGPLALEQRRDTVERVDGVHARQFRR